MIRVCDTDPCLHLVYEMWDVMIEKVKKAIYEHENIDESETSTFMMWSIKYLWLVGPKRNKLNPTRAEDLVIIHNNLRLLSRKNSEYLDEKTKMWDVGGSDDVLGSLEETDIHRFVDLSLDDPEMESVFFEDSQENAL
ncbi:hypothetical protein QQ045_013534 [Rhodiola kirilowii]